MEGAATPFSWRGAGLAVLAAVLVLVPFLDRPVSVDDPLFVWTAQHIAEDPLDPFGFELIWKQRPESMSRVSQNPVLGSYLLVPWGAASGWSEVAMHAGGLLWAALLALGVYALASRMTRRPLVAALATSLAPVAAISGTTLMCDVPMLAFWVWAIVLWRRGLDEDRVGLLLAAGMLAALAVLTKYSALGLVPLLFVDGLLRKRRPVRRTVAWLVALAIPLVALGAHELWTASLYGQGHFATTRAVQAETPGQGTLAQVLTALTFLGAGVASVLFLAPAALKRRGFAAWTILAAAGVGGAVLGREPLQRALEMRSAVSPSLAAQVGLWLVVGLGALALAVRGLVARPPAAGPGAGARSDGLLLALWTLGVLGTAAFVKWWVDGRGILPLAPAVGILLARAVDARTAATDESGGTTRTVPVSAGVGLALTAALALVVTRAEADLARSNRAAAEGVAEQFADRPGELWFQGHWGFHYYLERLGGKPWDYSSPRLAPGDLVVMPRNNSFVMNVPAAVARKKEVLTFPVPRWVTTMNPGAAGFHAASWGPVPFAFGRSPWAEEYLVAEATGRLGF